MNRCPNCMGDYDEFEPVRCPLCGYVLKPEICNVDPSKYFLPDYVKNYKSKINHNLMGLKASAGLFGFLLIIALVYAFNRFLVGGFDALYRWLFNDKGFLGILFFFLAFIVLCVFSSKKRATLFQVYKVKLGMIREFLNKGGL